jgi:hypothetical protein
VKTRVLVVAGALLAAVVPLSPEGVERWYSTGLYPVIQRVLTPVSNLVPIALADISAGLLVGAGVIVFTRRTRVLGVRRAAIRTSASLVSATATGYLLFLLLWGLNYRRVPLVEKLDWERSRVTVAAAVALANEAATAVNAEFASAHAAGREPASLDVAFHQVQNDLGAARGIIPGISKLSLLSLYFRRAAIDGMTDPFFLEIIVNPDLLDIERPFVVAHEWGHLAGYADESEANFIAWLTCLRGDALARYSGWLAAYEHAAGALPREMRAGLVPLARGPLGDLQAMAARYERSSPVVRTAARGVYDGYLRANGVQEGIASYDAVLRLMLGTRFGPERAPLRR